MYKDSISKTLQLQLNETLELGGSISRLMSNWIKTNAIQLSNLKSVTLFFLKTWVRTYYFIKKNNRIVQRRSLLTRSKSSLWFRRKTNCARHAQAWLDLVRIYYHILYVWTLVWVARQCQEPKSKAGPVGRPSRRLDASICSCPRLQISSEPSPTHCIGRPSGISSASTSRNNLLRLICAEHINSGEILCQPVRPVGRTGQTGYTEFRAEPTTRQRPRRSSRN
jgi:hypothetical protein